MTQDEFIKFCLERVNPPKTFNIQRGDKSNWSYKEYEKDGKQCCEMITHKTIRQCADKIEDARYSMFMNIFYDGILAPRSGYQFDEIDPH